MTQDKTILQQAHDIVFERNEEKERMYGPFEEGMEQTARIASELSRKDISTFDVYNVLIALKLSRASWNYKQDNYLDAVAYMASLDNHLNKKQQADEPNKGISVDQGLGSGKGDLPKGRSQNPIHKVIGRDGRAGSSNPKKQRRGIR